MPALAFLSGVSGIAYEVLYVRLISAYVGNIFYVSAALLAIFFFGIALGSLIARRYVAYLKQIEIGIGVYAIGLGLAFNTLGLSITQWVAGIPGPDQVVLPLFVFSILAIPATAIGFSLPLFAIFIEHYRREAETFSATYAIYNIGAAISVVTIEYLLIWNLGISTSIYLIASINIFIGAWLFFVDPPPGSRQASVRGLIEELDAGTRKIVVLLGLISVVSGVAQLNLFNLTYNIIGPHNENFALLIGTTLLSIAIAALLVQFTGFRFVHSLAAVAVLGLLPFTVFTPLLDYYTGLHAWAGGSTAGKIFAKICLLAALMLPIFVAFGTTIPSIVKQTGMRYAGLLLAISAAGNAIGYLGYIFFVHTHWLHFTVIVGCSIAAVLCFWYLRLAVWPKRAVALGVVILLSGYLVERAWPEDLYSKSYAERYSRNVEFMPRNPISTEIIRRQGNESIFVTMQNGDIELHFNGYRSLTFGKSQLSVLREAMAGTVAAYFTEQHQQVLTMGLGSGITAGAAANLFRQVTVAEINPTMLETAARFRAENDDVLTRGNVDIHIQDGLVTLLESEQRYDAIINTVPTPRYFAANKLWTIDVFEAAKSRLKPSGVFVGWLDSRLGDEGVRIMQNTLNKAFEQCLYLYLSAGYFVFVCGVEDLKFDPAASSLRVPMIERHLAGSQWPGDMAYFFRTLLFASSNPIPENTAVNSIDRPWLEFIHQPEGQYDDIFRSFTRLLGRDPFDDAIKANLCQAIRILEPQNTVNIERWCRSRA